MKRYRPILLVVVTVLVGCAAPTGPATGWEQLQLNAEIDRLCACIGASRASGITFFERWRGELRGCNARVHLIVEGKTREYFLRFDEHRHLLTFWPEDWSPHTPEGTGYDNVKDPALRQFLIGRVEATNRCLDYVLYPPAVIQPDGQYFQVTYYSAPAQDIHSNALGFIDPYFSFTVSRKGIIIAFRGPSA